MGKIDWIETENPEVRFENNAIGRIKKEVWDADEAQLDKWLKEDFEIPSPSELGKANCYIQTTPRHRLVERSSGRMLRMPWRCAANWSGCFPGNTVS